MLYTADFGGIIRAVRCNCPSTHVSPAKIMDRFRVFETCREVEIWVEVGGEFHPLSILHEGVQVQETLFVVVASTEYVLATLFILCSCPCWAPMRHVAHIRSDDVPGFHSSQVGTYERAS